MKSKFKEKIKTFLLVVLCVAVALAISFFLRSRGYLEPLDCKGKNSIFIERGSYRFCFDKEKKQPSWVMQFVEKGAFREKQREYFSSYSPDPDIPKEDQATQSDYEGSSFVISTFLFPVSQVFNGEEEHHSQYFFSVTSPQNQDFHHGYWIKLRDRVKALASVQDRDKVVVLSGPLFFSEKRTVVEPGEVPAPSHFFQLIAPTPNSEEIEAYIVPNEKINENTPLSEFEVSMKEFERQTGIKSAEKIAIYLFYPMPGVP